MKNNRLYFYRFKDAEKYIRLKQKGIDITIGNGKTIGLIKAASHHCQVLIATQSVSMVNNFSPDDLVVIERKGRDSQYKRYTSDELSAYLDEFSTGDIWEHNIIGGKS